MQAVYPKPDDALRRKVQDAYKEVFPQALVDVSDGYQGRLHVVLVSREFDDMPEMERNKILGDIARDALGDDAVRVSLLLAYSPDELK